MGEVLKRKPQVGDMLLYVGETNDYVTHDKMYVVQGIDSEGDPFIYDDDGDYEYIRPHSYGNYHVAKAEDPGYIEIVEYTEIQDELYGLIVHVDKKGFDTVSKAAKAHIRAKARADIEAQIAVLEAKLKEL